MASGVHLRRPPHVGRQMRGLVAVGMCRTRLAQRRAAQRLVRSLALALAARLRLFAVLKAVGQRRPGGARRLVTFKALRASKPPGLQVQMQLGQVGLHVLARGVLLFQHLKRSNTPHSKEGAQASKRFVRESVEGGGGKGGDKKQQNTNISFRESRPLFRAIRCERSLVGGRRPSSQRTALIDCFAHSEPIREVTRSDSRGPSCRPTHQAVLNRQGGCTGDAVVYLRPLPRMAHAKS